MNVEFFAIMIPIISIVGAFIMIIYLRKYENTERMAMIEKGVGPEFLNIRKPRNTSFPLRSALLLIGAGLGLLMGHILERNFDMQEEVAYFSMLFIFGGIGLGLAYIIEENKNAKRKE
ncbi:MAG TPA: DUF6249 domain-containing protein [Ohtaekwangia sp.]|uniref:DUF6249 domain-containing protein n=1 Tax=Ohtaekwangia sp. TaxID=2066019 RepID=UPI002F926537